MKVQLLQNYPSQKVPEEMRPTNPGVAPAERLTYLTVKEVAALLRKTERTIY